MGQGEHQRVDVERGSVRQPGREGKKRPSIDTW
jgi:hypothetical protein